MRGTGENSHWHWENMQLNTGRPERGVNPDPSGLLEKKIFFAS